MPLYDEQTMETNVPGLYVAGTVVGGTQEKYRVFIENCHVHVDRIVSALIGSAPAPIPAAAGPAGNLMHPRNQRIAQASSPPAGVCLGGVWIMPGCCTHYY